MSEVPGNLHAYIPVFIHFMLGVHVFSVSLAARPQPLIVVVDDMSYIWYDVTLRLLIDYI